MKIVIANSQKWFEPTDELKSNFDLLIIKSKEQLNLKDLKKFYPDIIFFPHWNWIIPEEIFDSYTCIGFHTSDLPFGRGGSPIQNLIIRKIKQTFVCAIKVEKILDAGPIYTKKIINLDGSLWQIFEHLNKLINLMMLELIRDLPDPEPQKGTPVVFRRLSKHDNKIKKNNSLDDVYDRIRMVDEESYPNAFLQYGNLLVEFKNVSFSKDKVQCTAIITEDKNKSQ